MSTKVFVGNLAFRMTDQALQEAFSECGLVKSGVIITRGRRSLGYGFVEFDSTDVATSAVDKMNKKELFGRPIKVEVAKDPSERVQSGGKENVPKRVGNRRGGASLAKTPNGGGNPSTITRDGYVKQQQSPASGYAPSEATNNSGTPPKKSNNRLRRKPRKVIPKSERVPSKTTLFVANLPFSVDDEQLKQIFEGTNLKEAHVVRTRNQRSRGYGFVEFNNETDQLNALKERNNIEVDGTKGKRIISVTISNSASSTQEVSSSPTKV